jgi:hypothetical protein
MKAMNMKAPKSPYLKKQNEYDKDMRPMIENPHAFRKNWPRKKARVNRSRRRRINVLVQEAVAKGQCEELSPVLLKSQKPLHQVKKMGIRSLRVYMETKRRNKTETESSDTSTIRQR